MIGKADSYGVVIPKQNVPNLMLHAWAREAVGSGHLKIYPVSHIWEAFELMTGVPLGITKFTTPEEFPEGSALATIDQKLQEIEDDELGEEEDEEPKDVTKKSKKAARNL